MHNASTVNIKGESYRIKEKKKDGFFRAEIPDEKGQPPN
nr:hypothetical protein [Brevibacillus massiliensis]